MKKNYLCIRITLLMAVILSFSNAWAQNTVSGRVTAADNSPIPGIAVTVKGTTTGTATDVDGKYTLNNLPDNATLVFSFIGFTTQEVPVGNRTTIDVKMSEDVKTLSEVVVVGYGTQQKKDVTGGVVAITSKDFNRGVIASPEQLLQGRAAGVQMTPASGEPGAGVNIRIRGTTSVRGGNNPLYVIDGVPVSGDNTGDGGADYGAGGGSTKNPLNFMNPADIENITILKDASAAAIYGARGANGVVLITTKRGKAGQQNLNFSASTSVSSTLKRYDLLSAADFLKAQQSVESDITDPLVNGGGNTDWQNEIFRTGISQTYNLDFGGGNDDTRYYFSLGYTDQQGIIKNSSLTRLTGRINASHELFSDRLKLDLQLTTSGIKDRFAPISNNAGFQGSLLGAALQANPTYPVYNSQGRYYSPNPYNAFGNPTGEYRNAVAMLNEISDTGLTNRTLASVSATLKLYKSLSYKVNLGIDYSNSERAQKINPLLMGYNGSNATYTPINATIPIITNIQVERGLNSVPTRSVSSGLIEHTLSLNEKVGVGQLDAVVGYSYQKFENRGNILMSGYFQDTTGVTDNIGGVNNEDNKAFWAFSDNTPYELQSYFGRLNYNIKDKYLLTATVRVDGSSKFGTNNKYGTFPSFAAAWRIANESFMPEGVFSDLKLRGSWGITGNQEFPANLTRPTRIYDPNNNTSNADNAANDDLKWEQTQQWSVGVDFGFLNGRLNGSIDYFDKATKDILYRDFNPNPISPSPFIWRNIDALIINRGVEFAVNYKVLTEKTLNWDVAYNMTFLKNNVDRLAGSFRPTGNINGQGLSGAFAQRIQEGYPLFAFFVPQYNGLDENGNAIYPNDDTPTYQGSPQPTFNFGLTNNFTYKNWNLNVFINGATGFYVYNNTANALFYKAALNLARNVTYEVANSNEFNYNAGSVSSRFLEKGDFVRLSNVSLGYTFNLPQTSSIRSLQLTLTGQNLLLLTGYSGIDPEVNTNKEKDGVPSLGIDYTAYPSARVFTLGLTAGF